MDTVEWIRHQQCGVVRTEGKNEWRTDVSAYAVAGGDLLGLSLFGSSTTLDAIRANVSMGKSLMFYPHGDRTGYGQWFKTKENKYQLFKTRLPFLQKDHYVLLNKCLLEPPLEGEEVFVLGHWGETELQIIGRGLRQHLTIAVLPAWVEWLYQRNQQLALGKITGVSGSGFRIYRIPLLACKWADLIREGLQTGALQFTEATHGPR
jgi:hypothetical protein